MSSSTSYSEPIPEKKGTKKGLGPGLRVVVFLLLVVVTLLVLGEVLEAVMYRLDANYPKIRQMMALKGEQHDVVYLGDSTTLEGINPAIVDDELDIRSYNLATGGQTMLEGELILRNYLLHNNRPRLVMLGIYVNRKGSETVGGTINPNVYMGLTDSVKELHHRRVIEATNEPPPLRFELFNALKAYRYRTAVDRFIKFVIAGRSRIPELIQGHVAFDFTRGANLGAEHPVRKEIRGLDNLLAMCRDERLPVLLFEAPNHPGYSELSIGRSEVLSDLQNRVGTFPILEFRSFNDEGSLVYAGDEWVGLNHLNCRGSTRFTREQIVPYLAHYLNK